MIPGAAVATMSLAKATTAGEAASLEAESLVRRARAGDEAAFALLYRRHYRFVHGVVLARVPAFAAEDVAQEAFLSAWRKLASLRDAAAFTSWLASIARNGATDWHRRNADAPDPLPEDVPSVEGPDRADALAVLAALKQLPEAYRETMTLRLVEGLSGPEIAGATGLTEGSVRVNLCRGLKRLREILAGTNP